MSRLTEEIRRLSRKIDNIEQRLEKVEESHNPKFTAPEAPKEPKFKVGDRFIPHKPKDENEYPTWWRLMDKYDGKTMTVAEITSTGNLGVGIDIDGNDWCFNPSWCTKVEEPKFKKGDWVRKIIKGSKWLCIKTVIMDDTEEIAYSEGKIYNSEKDDCITDEQGLINHWWTVDYFNQYFKKVELT